MSVVLLQQHQAHDILFHTLFGSDMDAISEFVFASAVRLHAIVKCEFLAAMMDGVVTRREKGQDCIKALFFLFLNVDMVLKEYVCAPGSRAAFAAAMNIKLSPNSKDDGLEKLHAWSMVGTKQMDAAKARGFFRVLHDKLVKNWLQDERLTASDFVRMVRDEYLVA